MASLLRPVPMLLLAPFIASVAEGCDCGARTAAPPHPTPTAGPDPVVLTDDGCVVDVPRLDPSVHRGVCYAHNYQANGSRGYGSETSRRSLRELREVGVDWLSLTPFAFMAGLSSPEVRMIGDYPAGESDERMHRELASAEELGFKVMLKPHIWVRGGGWRGAIRFDTEAEWDRWFSSYRDYMLHYAAMAETGGAEALVVGVETDHITMSHEAEWRDLIREVRTRYQGQIVYAANWDKVEDVPIWDAVDAIGVQFYPPLARESGQPLAALRENMDAWFDRLGALARRTGRPVILTEVGYRSVRDCELRPHEWPERDSEEPVVDPQAQARAYRVLLQASAGKDWLRGIYVWKWFTDPDANEEGPAGFSPRDKPAEAVLRTAFSESCPPAESN
ncbi:MAG: hypothetical protein AAGF12_42355 [Myxococcota bacterium]